MSRLTPRGRNGEFSPDSTNLTGVVVESSIGVSATGFESFFLRWNFSDWLIMAQDLQDSFGFL